MRVKRAVPSVPSMSIGSHKCLSKSMALPMLQGAVMYSSEKQPRRLDAEPAEREPHGDKRNHEVRRSHSEVR